MYRVYQLQSIKHPSAFNLLAVMLTFLYVLTPLFFFSYVPMWDGYQNVRYCYLPASDSFLLQCFDHSAAFNNLLFGLTMRLGGGSLQSIYTVNIALGLLGIFFMYRLIRWMYPDKLGRFARLLIAFLFGLTPIFSAHIVQPSLDFALPVYSAALLYFLWKRQHVWAGVAGLLLAFTKETGFMAYGVLSGWYVIFMLLSRERRLLLRPNTVSLLLPFFGFAALSAMHTLRAQHGGTFANLLKEMFIFNESPDFFLAQLSSLALFHFSWVMSLLIVLGTTAGMARAVVTKKYHPLWTMAYLWLCGLSMIWFLTRIPFVNNPRYMLPALPIFILLFAEALSLLPRIRWQAATACLLLALAYVSNFTTLDPLSVHLHGAFAFGRHLLLDPRMDRDGTPRDELVHNYQHTYFDRLFQAAVRRHGMESTYVINGQLTWFGYEDFASFDRKSGKRVIVTRAREHENYYRVRIVSVEEAIEQTIDPMVYYVEYPTVDREYDRVRLAQHYRYEGSTVEDLDGYTLHVARYVRH